MGWLSWLHLLFLVYSSQFNCSTSFNSSSSPSSGHLCHPDDSSALLQFYNSLSIGTGTYFAFYSRTVFWDKSKDCCTWSGITCERVTGHVIGLNLGRSGLQGNIHDNSSLFSLAHLQKLNLSYNDFRGSPLSSNFGGFVSMTHLDLFYSNFSGHIPLEISYLSKLVLLSLSPMSLEMSLETLVFKRLVQNLTNLKELCLDQVNMSSVALDLFMNLSSSLTFLRLDDCNLQGKFPEKTFRLPNLEEIYLTHNSELTGSFPKSNWSSPLAYLDLSHTRILIDLPYMTRILKSLSALYLRHCNFVGSSYPALLGNFSQIKRLYLSDNGFGGQIPWSLLNLRGLIELDISNNNFVGPLPEVHRNSTTTSSSLYDPSMKQLVGHVPLHLTEIILFNNLLNGIIPSWLYVLPSLKILDLGYNQLTGNINEFQSTSLLYLYLDSNNLQGVIPSSIFIQEQLRQISLSSNNLSGVLEFQKFEKLQSLAILSLSNNHMSVSFNNFSNFYLPELWLLELSSCNITEFPYFLRALPELTWIDLSHNRIQGNIPTWLLDVGKNSLHNLNLSHNFLTGIQQHLPWMNLQILDLRSNLLQGQLLIPPPSTQVFFASNNQFTGGLPSTICNLSSLVVLDLSNNSLSGEIPPCIGNFSENLSVLDLRKNKFVGMIPATFAKGNVLRNLDLNGNQFEGPLPQSLLNCTYLEVLDLGNNTINDTFPHRLESLPALQVLILRSNQFHGAISNPTTRFPFRKLRIMDLSHNQFSGLLPTNYFENLMAMVNVREDELRYMGQEYYEDSVIVTMKGLYIELVKIQTMYTIIDFSSNGFEGDIPKVISKLNSLKGLNLSHNKLIGLIPPSFSNLTQLERLDISSNKLIGKIPWQLAKLTFLAKLDLSENQLVGSIPRGRQFDTFSNDSYSGNLGLCGFPLSKTCTNKGAHQPFQGEDDLEHENGIDWKVVLMGYGCGMIIGLSVGYIVLSNRKVDWFMKELGRELRSKILKRPKQSARISTRRRN